MKLPFSLIQILVGIIKGIFVAERNGGTGAEKELAVMSAIGGNMTKVNGWLDYLKYFSLISGLIKIIIKYLNENLGKDWGKENDDNTK